jgi:hypothetical protein
MHLGHPQLAGDKDAACSSASVLSHMLVFWEMCAFRGRDPDLSEMLRLSLQAKLGTNSMKALTPEPNHNSSALAKEGLQGRKISLGANYFVTHATR